MRRFSAGSVRPLQGHTTLRKICPTRRYGFASCSLITKSSTPLKWAERLLKTQIWKCFASNVLGSEFSANSLTADAMPETQPNLMETLRRYWGYHEFRPRQEAIIRSLLAGRDTCVVMPTGGGKSLCYQLPAVVSGKTTIVVSPLIALMQDQAAQLAQMGISAAAVNSFQTSSETSKIMTAAKRGDYRLIYLSPQRLARPATFYALIQVPIGFFAVDEAHC